LKRTKGEGKEPREEKQRARVTERRRRTHAEE